MFGPASLDVGFRPFAVLAIATACAGAGAAAGRLGVGQGDAYDVVTLLALTAAALGVALLEKRDADAERAARQQYYADQAERIAEKGRIPRMAGELPQAAHSGFNVGLDWMVHPLADPEEQKAQAYGRRDLGVGRNASSTQDCDTGHDQTDPPVFEFDPAHADSSPLKIMTGSTERPVPVSRCASKLPSQPLTRVTRRKVA